MGLVKKTAVILAIATCLGRTPCVTEALAIEPTFDPYSTDQPGARSTPAPQAATPAAPSFFTFSDTIISYRFESDTKQPGNAGGAGRTIDGRSAPKNIITFANTNAWEYGTNFFNIDFIKSGSQDPTGYKYPFSSIATGEGALEYFAVYRGTLGLNAMTGTKMFAIPGLVKEVSIAYGFNSDKDSRSFRNDQLDLLGGINLALDVPVGFVSVAAQAYKSYNHNALIPSRRTTVYDWAPELELTYGIPLPFTSLPLSLNGYIVMIWPRGNDDFGNATRLQFQSRSDLVLDVGKLIYDQPNRLSAFAGFYYYQNKFGADQRFIPGANQKTFLAGIALHLN